MAEKRPKQPTDEAIKAKALSRWEGEGGAPIEGRKPKRPRDMNQWAKRMVDIATGSLEEPVESGFTKRARAGGKKGGSARAAALSPEQRSEIARAAAAARWKKS